MCLRRNNPILSENIRDVTDEEYLPELPVALSEEPAETVLSSNLLI